MSWRFIFFVLIMSVAFEASAQHKASPIALSSGGGYFKSSTRSNSWTVGQLAVTTFATANHKATQGFQQPEEELIISGKILTETGIAVPEVTVTLSGTVNKNMITSADGLYKFKVARGGNYIITPTKTNDVTTNNGITTLDISLIRRHVLGSTLLGSPYKIIAADATNNSSVSTGDIPLIRIVVLNSSAKFPPSNTRLWEFVSGFADVSPFSFTKTRTYTNLTVNQTNQNFIGVKLGDVNNNWNPSTQ